MSPHPRRKSDVESHAPSSHQLGLATKQDSSNDLGRSGSIKHVVRRASMRLNHWAASSFKHSNGRGREVDRIPPVPLSRSHLVGRTNCSAPQSKVDLPLLDTKRSSSLPGNFPEPVHTTQGTRTRISPATDSSPSTGESPRRKDSRKHDPIDDMIQTALKTSSKLQTFVCQTGSQRLVDTAGGMRVTHTREDVARPLSSKETVRHRLLFVCASVSLATDFQEFQRRQAQKSRSQHCKDSLDSPLSPRGMISGAKQQALHDFVASQAPIDDAERSDLEAAVIVGTKSQIINAIGHSLGLGSSLGLMCAFEARRLSDTSYGQFPELRMLLREHAAPTERIRSFSSTMDSWWSRQFGAYHHHYSSISSLMQQTPVSDVASNNAPAQLNTQSSFAEAAGVRPPSVASRSETSSRSRRTSTRSSTGSLRRVSSKASRRTARRPGKTCLSLNKPLPPPVPAPELPRRSSQRPASTAWNAPRSRCSIQPESVPRKGSQEGESTELKNEGSMAQTPSGASDTHIASQLSISSKSQSSRTGSSKSRSVERRREKCLELEEGRREVHPALVSSVEDQIEAFVQELRPPQMWGKIGMEPRLLPLQTIAPARA